MAEDKPIPPDNEPVKVYPDLRQSFNLLVICIAVQLMAGIFFAPLLSQYDEDPLMGPFIFLLLYILMFGFVWWYAQRQRASHQGDTSFSYRAIPLLAYFWIFLLTIALSVLLEPLVEWLPMPDEMWEELSRFSRQKDPFTFLTLAIAAPIFEEHIFRGVILHGLLKNYRPGRAIFLSALIFGIVHLNPWQFVTAFVLGMLIGWLYWRSGSLRPGLFLHFLINSMAFGFRFLIDLNDRAAMENSTRVLVGSDYYPYVLMSCAVLAGLAGWALYLQFKDRAAPY